MSNKKHWMNQWQVQEGMTDNHETEAWSIATWVPSSKKQLAASVRENDSKKEWLTERGNDCES